MKTTHRIGRLVFVTACALAASLPAAASDSATDLDSDRWTSVRPTVPFDPGMWAPRAGLRAVELRNDLYVMGGRGPFSFETQTLLYGDV